MLYPIRTVQRRSPFFYLLAPLSVLFISVLAINPALQLQKGLETATADTTSEFHSSYLSPVPEARSEAFWLSRSPNQTELTPVAWKPPVTAGDYIFLNYGPHNQRKLEVVLVQEEEDLPTKVVTDYNSHRHFILTCRDITKTDQPYLKLSIDADSETATVVDVDYKTL